MSDIELPDYQVSIIKAQLDKISELEARLAKWESGKNPDHYGPHCAGLCEGAAYTVKIRELEARLAEKEVTVQRLRNTLSSVAGWYLPETLQRADTRSKTISKKSFG